MPTFTEHNFFPVMSICVLRGVIPIFNRLNSKFQYISTHCTLKINTTKCHKHRELTPLSAMEQFTAREVHLHSRWDSKNKTGHIFKSSAGNLHKLLLTRHLPCLSPTCLHSPIYSSFCSFITSACQETIRKVPTQTTWGAVTSWFSDA